MLNSVGANIVLEIISQIMQKILPPRKQAGIINIGFEVFIIILIICGTAIPTNDTGPANAVTTAERNPERTISSVRSIFTFTPALAA